MAFSSFWAILLPASGQLLPEWTATYDSTRHDFGANMTVDGQGNVCVLVDSFGDFATVKYAPDGTLLWTDTYDSSQEDVPGNITADGAGNLWVTGISRTNNLPGNVVTIKYAPNGDRLWVRRADETNTTAQYPVVTLDAAGHGYVVTSSITDGTSFVVIKYDSDGSLLWTRRYAVPSGARVGFVHATVAEAGNLIVVGSILNNVDPTRLAFLKYDPSGNLLSAALNTLETVSDFVRGATTDLDGNVYVIAAVEYPAPSRTLHYLTAKYNSTGVLLWSALRAPTDGYHAIPEAVKLDSAGNVIVTGYETRPIDEDEDTHATVTIKYAPDGSQLWSARSTFQRTPASLAVDGDGNIYVAGNTTPYNSPSATFLLKYAPNGSQLWYTEVPSVLFQKFALAASGDLYLNDNIFNTNTGWAVETRKFAQTIAPGQPTATIVPLLTEVFPGASVTLTSLVSGPGPFTYKWLHYGYGTGQTNATFTVTNVQFEYFHQGDFSVVVSNASGYTISPEARISVLRPPVIWFQSGPLSSADQFVSIGERVTFAITSVGTEPFSFQWYFNDSPISGATHSVLTIPSMSASNAGNYYVVVTNRAGTTNSSVAKLVLILPPVSLANANPIQINSNNVTPYPSEIIVNGVAGTAVKVRVTLCGLTADYPSFLRVLLEGPLGQSVMLMSGVGNDDGANNATLTFDDATYEFPWDAVVSGTYKPTNLGSEEPLPLPAPEGPWGGMLSVFNGLDPNGSWRLFVDDVSGEPAEISCGWQLTVLAAAPAGDSRPSIHSIVRLGDRVSLQWTGAPGRRLQRTSSLTNPNWEDITESEGQSSIQLPIGGAPEFFRLAGP